MNEDEVDAELRSAVFRCGVKKFGIGAHGIGVCGRETKRVSTIPGQGLVPCCSSCRVRGIVRRKPRPKEAMRLIAAEVMES